LILIYIYIYIPIIIYSNVKLNPISEITPEFKIEFDKKVKEFRKSYIINNQYYPFIELYIDRKSLFYDAYNQIMNKSTLGLKSGFRINYIGEQGVDYGGLLR